MQDSATVILLPLDERPVNRTLPQEIGNIGRIDVQIPPLDILPTQRRSANLHELNQWFERVIESYAHVHVIVSIDLIAYGGLIPSRTSPLSAFAAIEAVHHIQTLCRSHQHVDDVVSLSTIMRAPAYDNGAEEPLYWATYGKRLHHLGVQLYGEFAEALRSTSLPNRPTENQPSDIPQAIREDYERRRLRNHLVNMYALCSLSDDNRETVLLTVDDSAPKSANALEQHWAQYWIDATERQAAAISYAGADDTACTALARVSVPGTAFQVWFTRPDDLDRVAKFENQPLAVAVVQRARAMNANVRLIVDRAEIDPQLPVLVIHPPDDRNRDHCSMQAEGHPFNPSASDLTAATHTRNAVCTLLEAGLMVGVADLRFANGGDPVLTSQLATAGALSDLTAYAGWNTAGNALGTAMATIAIAAARHRDGFDHKASEIALIRRIVEDVLYQTEVRFLAMQAFGLDSDISISASTVEVDAVKLFVQQHLNDAIDALSFRTAWLVTSVSFPWDRLFEIDFDIHEKEVSKHGFDA